MNLWQIQPKQPEFLSHLQSLHICLFKENMSIGVGRRWDALETLPFVALALRSLHHHSTTASLLLQSTVRSSDFPTSSINLTQMEVTAFLCCTSVSIYSEALLDQSKTAGLHQTFQSAYSKFKYSFHWRLQ